jgi:glutamyl-Q tRNA(Asp) synthetase
MSYTGRFAPSPTGPLHFGSLVAAAGSYLDARAQGGRWLVRIEDVDAPRTVPGAAGEILRALEAYALEWDGEVVYQSRRTEAYRQALDRLRTAGRAFACGCSRKNLEEGRYPGTCRAGVARGRNARTWRFLVEDAEIAFEDRRCGWHRENLYKTCGDFVLLRADGCFAYQLAVVVDDAWQGVTDVVRGEDLLDSTPRQLALYQALGWDPPRYLHLPVAKDAHGVKLSKQTGAPAVDPRGDAATLAEALRFLGFRIETAPPREMLAEARIAAARTLTSRNVAGYSRLSPSGA